MSREHCITTVKGSNGRLYGCARRPVLDDFCFMHHPQIKAVKKARLEHAAAARKACWRGLHDFWCQVAIVALLQFIKKAGFRVPMEEKRG